MVGWVMQYGVSWIDWGLFSAVGDSFESWRFGCNLNYDANPTQSDSNEHSKHQGSVSLGPQWFSCSVTKTEDDIGGVFHSYGEDDCGAGRGSTVGWEWYCCWMDPSIVQHSHHIHITGP